MSMNWDAEGDFAKVVDTLVPITLLSKGGQQETSMDAWKFRVQVTEIAGTEGDVLHWDAIWQLPSEDSLQIPGLVAVCWNRTALAGFLRKWKNFKGKRDCGAKHVEWN